MTKARFDIHGNSVSAEIIGHAGHADPRVCAGASMLACTLVEALRRAEADGYLVELSIDELAEGDVRIGILSTDYGRKHVQSIVRTIACGVELLASNYPDNVRVEIKE